jgi:hypothetical protein
MRPERRSKGSVLPIAPGLDCDLELVKLGGQLMVHSWVIRSGVKQYESWCPSSELATEKAWLAVAVNGGLL